MEYVKENFSTLNNNIAIVYSFTDYGAQKRKEIWKGLKPEETRQMKL